MFKIILVFSIVFFTISVIHAKGKLDWWEGKLILNSGESLSGFISYSPELDIVSICKGEADEIKSFSALKVLSFEYFDDEYETTRKFVSLDYIHPTSYKSKLFFELVLNGELKLLRRAITFRQFYSLNNQSLDENFGGHVYYAFNGDDFINLKRFKKQIYPLILQGHEKEINNFINENNLKLRSKQHQVMLIDYFNFLLDDKRNNMKYMFSSN